MSYNLLEIRFFIFIYLGVENCAAVKAQIVEALKSCCMESQFGEKILQVLQKSTIWSQYKDQRHDLFLTNTSSVKAIGNFTNANFPLSIEFLFKKF